jgi:hypothetical protein
MAVRPHWRSAVTFSEDGPGVTLMHESPELKVVLVGLGVGQSLPVHPGPSASFHFLDVGGVMVVGTEEVDVAAGATVVVPTGVSRGSGRRPGWCSWEALARRVSQGGRTALTRVVYAAWCQRLHGLMPGSGLRRR